jgi:hypothetical protein
MGIGLSSLIRHSGFVIGHCGEPIATSGRK